MYYFDWLASVVMVKKANGKWRMCIVFTDLNKACPKDISYKGAINIVPRPNLGGKSIFILCLVHSIEGYSQTKAAKHNQCNILGAHRGRLCPHME